ncbi:MAG: phosphatidylglycerol lysyltransferase domain-containing protein [Candidatus Nomurabacteria bacterium]|nr:phosphatidylglycerol lysyltransferase domain-containing protein [Candidatus Nomurabacteria bacterium]
MIPIFPEFKKIKIEDKMDIELYTNRYLPYSDFNFTSLWAWNINDERMFSFLNENLVVLFTDYETNEKFLSYLGTNMPEDTVREIINYANKIGITPILKLIPEVSIKSITNPQFLIEEDDNNFDYIFSIPELLKLQGSKFKNKRHLMQKFIQDYPDSIFMSQNINDINIQEQMILLFHRWNLNKLSNDSTHDSEHEINTIKRILKTSNSHELVVSSVVLNNNVIAFSIDEILPNRYVISHFIKADNKYNGIYDYLNQKVSEFLFSKNALLWNWEQDLGIINLKKSKMSYRPVNFLKKFKISLILNK